MRLAYLLHKQILENYIQITIFITNRDSLTTLQLEIIGPRSLRDLGTEMDREVDSAFIQSVEHRPKPTIPEAGGIPLIDLSPLLHTTISDRNAALYGLVAEVEAACREWGFFQVVNHGVPSELLDRLLSASKEFFALSAEEKRRIGRGMVNPLGYYDSETTKNVRDWKEVFDSGVQDHHQMPATIDPECTKVMRWSNQWPEHPPQLREASEKYGTEVEKLCYKLLELTSLSLGLPTKRLNEFFKDHTSTIRLNHYPPCPSPQLALGVGHHKDAGAITVLFQDEVGGLDVRRKSNGEWYRVRPIPNSYIINMGDVVQVWSNDRYESAEHRVTLNSGRERFSIPFFLNPSHYVMVEPLEELLDEDNLAHYRAYNWGKFWMTRKQGNFGKIAKENIQITHFRKTE